jgi:hypothetical protein
MKVDEGELHGHGAPKAKIVRVRGIGSPVLVGKETVRTKRVVVWPLWSCREAEGQVHETWLENALGGYEGNPFAVEVKALLKESAGKGISIGVNRLCEPTERSQAYRKIAVVPTH